MYDPIATLAGIDQHWMTVIALCFVALIFNYAYFGEAIRLGFKHKTYSVPAAVTLVFLPHDISYLIQFNKWFIEYDHWFCKLWWVGLVFTAAIECVFFYQLLKYGRKEILPQVSQQTYVLLMFLVLASAVIAWAAIKQSINDDLYLFSFGWTLFWGAPLNISMMIRRHSTRGQSSWLWISYILMAIFYWAAVSFIDPYFRSPLWLGLLVLSVGWAVANLICIKHMPTYEPTLPKTELKGN